MSLDAELTKLARVLFDETDVDKSGFIEIGELERLIAQMNKDIKKKQNPAELKKEVQEAMQKLDTNKDNKISFDEFVAFARKLLE